MDVYNPGWFVKLKEKSGMWTKSLARVQLTAEDRRKYVSLYGIIYLEAKPFEGII